MTGLLGCVNVQKVFKIKIPPPQPIILVTKVSPGENNQQNLMLEDATEFMLHAYVSTFFQTYS